MVFIPMYNCENQIVRVLNQFDEKARKFIDEIVIVNNRSTDNGEKVAIEHINKIIGIKITVLRNKENYGLGGSHKVAINYAIDHQYDYLIVLHGDDQGSIQDIIPLLENGEHKINDCLLGARFCKGAELKGYSWFRTFGNKVYNILFSLFSKKRIYDLGSGLNCYKVEQFYNPYYFKFPDDLTFNYCMVLANVHLKHKVSFFPLTWREDDQVSNVKLFSQAFRVLNILREFAINKPRFFQSEHRAIIFPAYESEVIAYSSEGKL